MVHRNNPFLVPSANEALDLPRSNMKQIVIAFDVDGTLRCNCTETCRDVNRRIVDLLDIMLRMKNTRVMIWSGGGVDYARQFGEQFSSITQGRVHYASKIDSSTWKWGRPNIAVDDIQDTAMADINLIVREK